MADNRPVPMPPHIKAELERLRALMATDAEAYRRREIGSKRMEEEAKKIQPLRPLSAADTDLEYPLAAKGGGISAQHILNHIKSIDPSGEAISNNKMIDYIKSKKFAEKKIHPKQLPSLDDLHNTESDPYNRVIWPDEDKIKNYKAMMAKGRVAPHIVMDEHGNILDGQHRAVAAKEAGVPINAWVPTANKASGGVIDMDRMRLELMKGGGDVSKYRDPKTTKIQDWKWRKMQDVRKDMPIIEVPDYVQKNYGEFMNQQLARAQAAGLTPRDLLKAFTITQSSIGRGGLSHATATKTGMKLPNTGDEVRPEGAFAEWLGSPMGQKYLNAAERGMVHQPAINDIRQKFAPFGKHNQLTDQMIYAAQKMPAMSQSLNQAITGSKEDYRDFAEKMKGVAGAKSGFIGSMLGRGDLPTLDARQLNLHALPADVGIGSIMSRGKGQGAREAVDRLAARQAAMNLKIDPAMQPHYQHLAHHAVWDAAGNNKTTHNDIIKAMRGYKAGGITHAHHLDIEERPL